MLEPLTGDELPLANSDDPLIIVIDALDECDKDTAETLAELHILHKEYTVISSFMITLLRSPEGPSF